MKRQPIKVGRKVGYKEYCKLWERWERSKKPSSLCGADLFEHGDFVSPSGVAWRPCGIHYPGVLLIDWQSGRQHSIDFATAMRARMLGWIWRPDSKGPPPKFTISRWPDGSHYYVRKPDGDPVVFNGKEKFDTYDEAHRAGTRWSVMIRTKKSDA